MNRRPSRQRAARPNKGPSLPYKPEPTVQSGPAKAPERDFMPRAWAILACCLGLLGLVEFLAPRLPWMQGLRPPAFTQGVPGPAAPQPTPWPTPPALPAHPGKIQTRPSQVRKIMAAPPRSRPQPLRVAYFADSVIEGDLICSTLREKWQARLGGNNVGWVGMAPIDAWARDNIQQSFSPNWERHTVFKPGWQGQTFGPGGQAWRLAPGSGPGTVQFKPGRNTGKAGLASATLWYGPMGSQAARAEVTVDGHTESFSLDGQGPLNHVALSQGPTQSLELKIEAQAGQGFYGVTFDQGAGVDNFSTRGSHGGPLKRLDLEMLKELQVQRHYSLVLVQYGINALVLNKDPQFKWYRRELAAGLQQLQKGLPGAAVVLISATDRAVREGDAWVSDPYLPGLLAAQAAAADDVGIPFINAFDLMGGPGSMKAWAEASPRLAEHDYTHLSPLGARRFAEALWLKMQESGGSEREAKP